jgi:hypothetical protein
MRKRPNATQHEKEISTKVIDIVAYDGVDV